MILLSTGSSVGQLIVAILLFVAVLAACYFTTAWIAGYQKQHSFNRNIRVVETMKLTSNKYIQIIEVGGKYLAIAIGKDEVTFLTELSKEDITEVSSQNPANPLKKEEFQQILEQWKRRIPKGRQKKDE